MNDMAGSGATAPMTPPPRRAGTTVVLLAVEALGNGPDIAAIAAAVKALPGGARVLVRVAGPTGLELVRDVALHGVNVEALLAPAVLPPDDGIVFARMPPGSGCAELDDLALALSDIVIAAPGAETREAVRHLLLAAKVRGKPVCPPDCALTCVPVSGTSVAQGLDPLMPCWPGQCGWGRLEQVLLELLAFGWLGKDASEPGAHTKDLRRCFAKAWKPTHYFAPASWRETIPDHGAVDRTTPMVARFESLDRAALYGSYVHRDLIWLPHLAAAFAVLFAVLGALFEPEGVLGRVSPILELLLLLLIAASIGGARSAKLQDRWTACRLGAEQLRIARMCLPLMVVPPALATVETPSGQATNQDEGFMRRALTEVRRAVRDQGLPRLAPGYDAAQAGAWLKLIVDDQAGYHRKNHRKLERAETRLKCLTRIVFGATVVAVATHFFVHAWWLLIFTAAGPAFAAALHGAGTRLGIVHRAGLSEEMQQDLAKIGGEVDSFLKHMPSAEEDAWNRVRALALDAASAMGQENMSWHRLLRRERDEIPA